MPKTEEQLLTGLGDDIKRSALSKLQNDYVKVPYTDEPIKMLTDAMDRALESKPIYAEWDASVEYKIGARVMYCGEERMIMSTSIGIIPVLESDAWSTIGDY